MARVGAQLIGLDKVLKDLDQIQQLPNKQADFAGKAARVAMTGVNDAFAEEGPGWARRDPDTIRREKGRGRGILYYTGAGFRSIKPIFSADKVEIVFQKYYMKFHQEGIGGMKKRAVVVGQQYIQAIIDLAHKTFGWQK